VVQAIQLISLLEAGEVDYAFEYESVIQQHEFALMELPDSLNLGETGMNEQYGKATVQMDFQRFATVNPVFQGEQIKYGITIPSNAPTLKKLPCTFNSSIARRDRRSCSRTHIHC